MTTSTVDNTEGGILLATCSWKRPQTPEIEELYHRASRVHIETGKWSPYSLIQNTGISVHLASRAMILRNEAFFVDNKFKSFSTFTEKIKYLQGQCPPGMYYLYGRQNSSIWKLSKKEWRKFSPKDWHFGTILCKKTRNDANLHVGIDGDDGFTIWSFPFCESIVKKFYSDLYYSYFFSHEKFTSEKIVAVRKELKQIKKKEKELNRKRSRGSLIDQMEKERKVESVVKNGNADKKVRIKRKRRRQRRRRLAKQTKARKGLNLFGDSNEGITKKLEVIEISSDEEHFMNSDCANTVTSDDDVLTISKKGNCSSTIIIID